MNKLYKFIEHYSIFIPIIVAYLIGLITYQSLGYYIVFFFLAFLPAILGMPDPVGEFIDFVNKEKIKRKSEKYKHLIIDTHRYEFLDKINLFTPETLRLILECVNNNKKGFNKEKDDSVVGILLSNDFIVAPKGYTPSGFPYYFNENIWILVNKFKYEILKKYNTSTSKPFLLREDIKFRYTPKTFLLSIILGILRLLALLIIGVSFGSLTWIIWVLLMASVISIIVWSGDFIRIIFGI